MTKISFTIPGVLPSDPPQQVPVPAGVPAEVANLDPSRVTQVGINLMFSIAIIIAVVVLVISGMQWITSRGDPVKIQAAKSRMTYGVIGLVVVILSFVIVSLIYTFLTGQKGAF